MTDLAILDPDTHAEQDDQPAAKRPTLQQILTVENVADLLSDEELGRIADRCSQEFAYDMQSLEDAKWTERYKRWMDVAMQVRKAKTFPWPNAANIKFPLLTTASIQFQARAYPAIVDGANLVKGRVLGNDPAGMKQARAQRIGSHMTWQLLYDMPGWEEDTDKLLLMLPIVGVVIRKTYYDSIEKRNVSEMIPADDFVINYWAKSLKSAPRFTHILRRYPYQVEENIRSGLWYEVDLPAQTNEKDGSDTAPVEFLEQHCRMDLDGDGYPEPYVVTLLKDQPKVVRIAACFDKDDVKMAGNGLVSRITQKQYFTKYGFIPSPDGSFYDVGFGQLLDDITAGIDTILNQSLDAGALQNAQGGFIGSGINVRSGNMKFVLGEWKRVDVTGGTLAQNIVPLNLPGPSAVLFNLLELLISAGKEITSVQDILTGAGQGVNTPATTVLAQIQQATKVMTGIFKRIHRAFGQELQILFGLNRDFLDEKAYFNLADAPGEIGRADYQDKDMDVVPVSDPTSVNDAEKGAKAQALMIFIGDPMVNQKEIKQRYMEATGQRDIAKLFEVPPPPSDPKLLVEGARLALDKMKFDAQYDKDKAAAVTQFMDAAEQAAMLGLAPDAAMFAGAAMKLAMESTQYTLETPNGAQQPADGPGAMGGMEGPGGDAGLLPAPEGPPGGPDGSMGVGPEAGGGGPGAGAGIAPPPDLVG